MMHPLGAILSLVFFALAFVCLAYYIIVLVRVTLALRSIPTLRFGLSLPAPESGYAHGHWPSVCAIVPAHNEETVIGEIARMLLRQDYPELRLVFVLDRCTDRTRQVLTDTIAAESPNRANIEIIENQSCPEDWSGKTHALWRGFRDSKGAHDAALLLFLDADTLPEPKCIRAAVALLQHRSLDLLSLLSTLTTDQWFERVVQPAASFELIRQYPLDHANDPKRKRHFANGQFMLFKRDAYLKLGGHERVKDAVLEDIAIAKLLSRKKYQIRGGIFLADGLLRCRMYRNWPAFKRGWKRILIEAASVKPVRLFKLAWQLRITGVVLPLVCVVAIAWSLFLWPSEARFIAISILAVSSFALLAFATTLSVIYRTQHTSLRFLPAYPIGAWLLSGLLEGAARDLLHGRATEWAGKSYVREIRT